MDIQEEELRDCIDSGLHLTHCDNDGFCKLCGNQEAPCEYCGQYCYLGEGCDEYNADGFGVKNILLPLQYEKNRTENQP